MKIRNTSERGQALIVIALAAIALFSIVGLAIDGSAKFSDRRHAQNAADTAALAGALGLANGETAPCGTYEEWECEALLLAEENGYDDFTDNEVWVFTCDEPLADRDGAPLNCGSYEGNPKYLSVIIRSHVKTFFARIFGTTQTTNVVQAVTFTRQGGPMFNGASIASYNPDTSAGCSGSFRIGGNATITLNGGGMWVNSDEPDCALEQQGGCPSNGAPLLVINGGGISSAGNENIDFDACVTPLPTITYNNTQLQIPEDVDMPDRPPECNPSMPGTAYQTGTDTWHIRPGYYTDFPQQSINGDLFGRRQNIIMDPGVYCTDRDISWQGSTFSSLDGTSGVTIYVTQGHDFSLNINSPISLDASNSGDYQGYLIIAETDFTGSRGSCTINGGTYLTLSGTIFAPYCDVTINGDNNSNSTVNLGTQVIGWNVQINGSSAINFNYLPADTAQNQKRVGLMK
jgi:hypothetical protein